VLDVHLRHSPAPQRVGQPHHSAAPNVTAALRGAQSNCVKVLLRDTRNGWYYQGPSEWTPEQDLALDVGHAARAVALAFEARLGDVEILLCYEDPRYNLILPVNRAKSRSDSAGML